MENFANSIVALMRDETIDQENTVPDLSQLSSSGRVSCCTHRRVQSVESYSFPHIIDDEELTRLLDASYFPHHHQHSRKGKGGRNEMESKQKNSLLYDVQPVLTQIFHQFSLSPLSCDVNDVKSGEPRSFTPIIRPTTGIWELSLISCLGFITYFSRRKRLTSRK